jgi:hypothetical protein
LKLNLLARFAMRPGFVLALLPLLGCSDRLSVTEFALDERSPAAAASTVSKPFDPDAVHSFFLNVDVVQMEREWLLDNLTDKKPPSGSVLFLGDLQWYFMYHDMHYGTNVLPRPIITFPDDKPISIKYDERKSPPEKTGAWFSPDPLEFEVLPKVTAADAMTLRVKWWSDGKEQIVGPAMVPDGHPALFLLNCSPDGVYLAVVLEPRIIADDEPDGAPEASPVESN